MATAEFSKFAGILSAALSQHQLLGFEIVQLEFPCFLYDPTDVGNLIFGSSAFSESSLYIWKFSVHVLLKPAATAAKSLQLCPTLCDPIDGSPPGSPVPGILQARTLEWVAISFNA